MYNTLVFIKSQSLVSKFSVSGRLFEVFLMFFKLKVEKKTMKNNEAFFFNLYALIIYVLRYHILI